ncbi:T9SS type A sorting domain-containing protein [Hymenobacter edaphi]|uniref:Uncharacterized protein n=1 Tax=Hymenobacter edaphi TaxID=2211146 RepID=A0A328BJX6_9BACT|nr:T9SS type A sorting domain-containing protein [Hymenobacter edaphi]RAK66965.1 hypothetical protein DLM85_12230 [Hymenobacter edaphi]
MKLFTRLVAATSLLLLQAPAWAATFTVQVDNNQYTPQVVNIAPGDVVRFELVAGTHPTVSESSPAAFSPFTLGPTLLTRSVTFATAGTYDYYCSAHGAPGRIGMWGSVRVSTPTPAQEATKQAAAQLNIFPNPVRGGEAVLTMGELKGGQAYRLRITNIIGREVQSVVLRPETLTSGQPINFAALPAGLYICSVLSNDKVLATKRVTVQN